MLEDDNWYILMMQINVLNYKWLEFVEIPFQDISTFHAVRRQIIYINDADTSITLGLNTRKHVFSGLRTTKAQTSLRFRTV